MNSTSPLMSVVIATPDNYQTIRTTISHLRRQTAAASLEIVIVAPSCAHLALVESELAVFACHSVVEVGPIKWVGSANAAGVRRATAPLVALAEDHCFPDPGWAASLIAAHEGPWAAVGPAFENANPLSAMSWAELFISYGPWLWPTAAREVEFLPGHNGSYKREVLLRYDDQLEALLETETLLHWDLRAAGYRLYLESAARVSHANFSLWSVWLPAQLHYGRLFAGARNRQLGPVRRLIYIAGSPLIPWVRLLRVAATVRSSPLRRAFWKCLPVLILGLVLDGIGQLAGYALGPGNQSAGMAHFEFHRARYIRAQERRELFGE